MKIESASVWETVNVISTDQMIRSISSSLEVLGHDYVSVCQATDFNLVSNICFAQKQ